MLRRKCSKKRRRWTSSLLVAGLLPGTQPVQPRPWQTGDVAVNAKTVGALAVAVVVGSAVAWSADAGKPVVSAPRPLVQLAILLDTSGSMEGMIRQAQTQLWAIVNEFATAERDGQKPILQVALYRYGTPTLGADNGYVRQLLPLTDDLDKVSEELFRLTTDGGDEYCGWVIRDAVQGLAWSGSRHDYKAVFIAGNEPFNQGKVDYRDACKQAVTRGIIVNTVHCAGAEDTLWADGAQLADGQFMRIDGGRAVVQVRAPQDAELARLNTALNATYVAYGRAGAEKKARQAAVDELSVGTGALAQRAAAKASAQYRNVGWDMVDAVAEKEVRLEDLRDEDLPENLRALTLDERKAFLATREQERKGIQARIRLLSEERQAFVTAETAKNVNQGTLGDSIRTTLRAQAARSGFRFSD